MTLPNAEIAVKVLGTGVPSGPNCDQLVWSLAPSAAGVVALAKESAQAALLANKSNAIDAISPEK
jgi:hypothetical protein